MKCEFKMVVFIVGVVLRLSKDKEEINEMRL